MEIQQLLGKTLTNVSRNGDEEIVFETDTGEKYRMFHDQDCCECVEIKSLDGDLQDLVGSPILMAEEATSDALLPNEVPAESQTWTFYKLATQKGYVTISWLGVSNGCYSERVDFERCQ